MPYCVAMLHNSLALLTVASILQSPGMAQSAQPPAFAVATIKPGRHITQGAQRPYAGGYEAIDVTVNDLISFAYNLPWGADGLVSGGPRWAYTDTFNIEAKSESAIEGKPLDRLTNEQISSLDRSMLQSLLESRFKLSVHHEARQVSGFALTVARGGPKLVHSSPSAMPPADAARTNAFGAKLPRPRAVGAPLTRGTIHASQVTMSWLAGHLQFQPESEGHTVIDKTGLPGTFDISLKWSSSEGLAADSSPKEGGGLPDLFTALQEQLGLSMERTRVTFDAIVIDSVEKPSEN
jgi:uncharacterized protein (TIGR03435 family)